MDEYVMQQVVADLLREAREAAAIRAALGSRATLASRFAGLHLDRWLLASARDAWRRIAAGRRAATSG
jgi:hypothetical protein